MNGTRDLKMDALKFGSITREHSKCNRSSFALASFERHEQDRPRWIHKGRKLWSGKLKTIGLES